MRDFNEQEWLERLKNAGSEQEVHRLVDEMERGNFDTLYKGLLEVAKDLIAALPEEARPTELRVKFPRVLNRIALLWPYPGECEEYLKSLVVADRGERQGFPFAIFAEITALRSYYHEMHPALFKGDIWTNSVRDF